MGNQRGGDTLDPSRKLSKSFWATAVVDIYVRRPPEGQLSLATAESHVRPDPKPLPKLPRTRLVISWSASRNHSATSAATQTAENRNTRAPPFVVGRTGGVVVIDVDAAIIGTGSASRRGFCRDIARNAFERQTRSFARPAVVWHSDICG